MGGPQSVYQQDTYPYLTKELGFLREAAKRQVPMLGVCLGAQLLAGALGGTVRPAEQKEIGWYPVMREPGAEGDPMMDAFGQTETVFQWHGDTYSLPKGAVRLSSSPLCEEQGFRYGDNCYALQFHVEMTEAIIRAWMMNAGNRKELAALEGTIDPMTIRRQSPQHIGRLGELSRHVAATFCDLVKRSTSSSRRSAHARKA
jgi:GMP synthase (glutamine-hydrolysing)